MITINKQKHRITGEIGVEICVGGFSRAWMKQKDVLRLYSKLGPIVEELREVVGACQDCGCTEFKPYSSELNCCVECGQIVEKNKASGHRICPWCKKETKMSAGCFDEDGSLWAVACGVCNCSGPLIEVDKNIWDFDDGSDNFDEHDRKFEEYCEKKAFEAWDGVKDEK